MPLADYQFEYINGPTSEVMGAGTSVDIVSVEGLFDMEIRDGDRAWTRAHGDLAGEHLLMAKEIFIDLEVIGDPSLQTYWDLVYKVQKLFTTRQYPQDTDRLTFKVPGLAERFIRARPFRRAFKRSGTTEGGNSAMSIILKAADPRFYFPTAGMRSSGAQSGTFNVTNNGSSNAYPRLTFSDGGAILTNNTHPVTFNLDGAPSGVIVDFDRMMRGVNDLIIYSGATSHYDKWVQPRYPVYLGSGINSLTVSAGTVTVEWYDTAI